MIDSVGDLAAVLVRSMVLLTGGLVAWLDIMLWRRNRKFLDRLVAALGWTIVGVAELLLLLPPLDVKPTWVRVALLNPGVSLIAVTELVRIWAIFKSKLNRGT